LIPESWTILVQQHNQNLVSPGGRPCEIKRWVKASGCHRLKHHADSFARIKVGRLRELAQVLVVLLNENRPGLWDQVVDFLGKHGTIANAEVRQIMGSDDTLAASKALKEWVQRGLLEVANPEAGKRIRRYKLPEADPTQRLFAEERGKQIGGSS
jgi:hypothetical protein